MTRKTRVRVLCGWGRFAFAFSIGWWGRGRWLGIGGVGGCSEGVAGFLQLLADVHPGVGFGHDGHSWCCGGWKIYLRSDSAGASLDFGRAAGNLGLDMLVMAVLALRKSIALSCNGHHTLDLSSHCHHTAIRVHIGHELHSFQSQS